jgi:hypothetical protein
MPESCTGACFQFVMFSSMMRGTRHADHFVERRVGRRVAQMATVFP